MNQYENALRAIHEQPASSAVGPSEIVLIHSFLHIWRKEGCPESLDPTQWEQVLQDAKKWISKTTLYVSLTCLVGVGWLRLDRPGWKVKRVWLGPVLATASVKKPRGVDA